MNKGSDISKAQRDAAKVGLKGKALQQDAKSVPAKQLPAKNPAGGGSMDKARVLAAEQAKRQQLTKSPQRSRR